MQQGRLAAGQPVRTACDPADRSGGAATRGTEDPGREAPLSAKDGDASTPDTMGRWSYDYASGDWHFSDELRVMWDLPLDDPQDLEPVFAQMHPDDRGAIETVVARAVRDVVPMSGQSRLATRSHGERVFSFIGEVVTGPDGPLRLEGWSIDVTTEVRAMTRDAVDGATRHRRAIEQVKGALMVCYRIDEVTAFAILRKQSNGFNVKINDLAEHVARAMTAGTARDGHVPPMMELLEAVARRLRRAAKDQPDPGAGSGPSGSLAN